MGSRWKTRYCLCCWWFCRVFCWKKRVRNSDMRNSPWKVTLITFLWRQISKKKKKSTEAGERCRIKVCSFSWKHYHDWELIHIFQCLSGHKMTMMMFHLHLCKNSDKVHESIVIKRIKRKKKEKKNPGWVLQYAPSILSCPSVSNISFI